MRFINYEKDIDYSQAKNCIVFIQIYTLGIFIGHVKTPVPYIRLEIFPYGWKRKHRLPLCIEFKRTK